MKLKLDENLPSTLADMLASCGHDVDTTIAEGLVGAVDDEVWTASQTAKRFFITQDLDFSDIRKFEPGTHQGVLVLRLREPGRQSLTERLLAIFQTEDVENWSGCFVVATEHKIRIRRPL